MRRGVLFLSFFFGLASVCYAAEEKNKQLDELTSIQLGDYSLKFEGENPKRPTTLDEPPALNSFKRDAFNPFLGLRFSTPLDSNNFFKSGR